MNGYSQQTDFYKSETSYGPRTEENQKTATVPRSQSSASNPLSKSIRASNNRKQSILMNGKAKQKSSSIRYHHHHQLKHYHIPFDTYQQQSVRPAHCPVRRSYPSGYSEYPQQITGGIATITPLATGQCRPVELGSYHQQPEHPTLVKVKAWYTVSKQGMTY